MGTEEELVYNIIETVQKGALSQDAKVDERVVRSFIRVYRAAALAKYSYKGLTIQDECFQHLGELQFSYSKPLQFIREMPKVIRLSDNFGIFFEKNGENIPIVNSEEFSLGLKSIFNGKLPKAKILNGKATVYIGKRSTTPCGTKPALNTVIPDFLDDIESLSNNIKLDVYAVLFDPDDASGYDWTTSIFPCPAELVKDIKTEILQKEYGIILQVKPDKITDGNDGTATGQKGNE